MAKNDDYISVVVKQRPGQRRRNIVALVTGCVVVAASAYLLGGAGTGRALREIGEDRDRLAAELQAESELRAQAQQSLSNLQVGADVDRQSVEDVRTQVKNQEHIIAELREEIAFYRGLMAPTERERGLGVRNWELYPTTSSRRFHYKLTVQQLAVKHAEMSGYVNIDIVGRYTGLDSEQTFSLHELSDQQKNRNIKLSFKYFQHIEGDLVLPDGFQPQRVDLVVYATKPNSARVEKHFSWVVQET